MGGGEIGRREGERRRKGRELHVTLHCIHRSHLFVVCIYLCLVTVSLY